MLQSVDTNVRLGAADEGSREELETGFTPLIHLSWQAHPEDPSLKKQVILGQQLFQPQV